MKRLIASIILSAFTAVSYCQSQNHNYVKVTTCYNSAGSGRSKVIYYDALGREEQTVLVGTSTSEGSIVSMVEYDEYGRTRRQWLQGHVDGISGNFTNESTVQSQIRSANGGDQSPFSLFQYEASPLNRPEYEFGPGSLWQTNNAHPVRTEYMLNISGNTQLDCKKYSVSYAISGDTIAATITNAGSWVTGSMSVTKTTDEDGSISYEFKDRNGEVTLTRQMAGAVCHDTYYIRDDWGNLLAVLPPMASDQMKQNGTWNSTSAAVANYAYLYCYDKRFRQIGRKLPSCCWVFTIYDRSDFPVLTQDGRQRDRGEWTVTIPDAWSRPCVVATKTGTHNLNTTIGTASVLASRGNNGTYAYSGFSYTPQDTLTIYYYDDYRFIGGSIPQSLNYAALSGYGTRLTDYPAGLLTGTMSFLLGDTPTSDYVCKTIFYDYHKKPVQTRSTNHLGGTDTEYRQYDFIGNLTKTKRIHTATGRTTRTQYDTYTYDAWDRLLTHRHRMEGCTEISLTDLGYDAIGRIHEDRRNGVANMKTTYSYNVRSWLTGLSNLKFSEALYYNVKRSSGQSAACWTGDLSGMEWAFNGGNDNYSYDFSYDKLHRLTDAQYDDDLGYGDAYSTNYGYDKNGNINSIMRQAWSIDDEPAPLDEMTLYYTGNQLQSAQSYADPDLFVDYYPYEMLQTSSPFAYDSNGNTIKDLHKNISQIEYNILNLPRRITYTDGSSATYTYNSIGEKLQVVYGTSRQMVVQPAIGVIGTDYDETAAEICEERTRTVTSTTDYCSNIVYNGSSVSRILLDREGYLTLSGSTPTYYFFMKDHLGSTRAVVNQGGTVKQEYQYYPFGKRWDDMYEYFKQPYQYNGKEMDEMHGLRWLDYGARMYEPALGRFMTMDPLAEKYYSISPYAYCANNPVNAIDIDGNLIIFVNGFHTGDGGSSSYWNGLDNQIMMYANDFNAKYIDGSLGGVFNTVLTSISNLSASHFGNSLAANNNLDFKNTDPYNRYHYGREYGSNFAESIINSLKAGEKITIVTHSMGAAFAKGLIVGLQEYAIANNINANEIIASELDLAPYQSDKQSAITNVPTTTISHKYDHIAGYKPIKGASNNVTRIEPTNIFNIIGEHSIESFSIDEIMKFWNPNK